MTMANFLQNQLKSKMNYSYGVFLVTTKNAFVPMKRVFSINIKS